MFCEIHTHSLVLLVVVGPHMSTQHEHQENIIHFEWPPFVSAGLSEAATGPGSVKVNPRVRGQIMETRPGAFTPNARPRGMKLQTAHRIRLFVKQTYMYFMAAAVLLFYFGLECVNISPWPRSNFLCFSSPLFFSFPLHVHFPPIPFKLRLLFWQRPFLFFVERAGVKGCSLCCFDRFREFIVASRAAVGV